MTAGTLAALFSGSDPVLLDGAMGTALRARGWPVDRPTVLANLEAPELVADVHRSHRAAGARLVTSNTFAIADAGSGWQDAASAGVRLAREAAGAGAPVAGSLAGAGAAGEARLSEAAALLVDAGVDVLVFETLTTIEDARRALALAAPGVPLVVCASSTDGSTSDCARVAAILALVREAAEPSITAGLNCCRGPADALQLAAAVDPIVAWVRPSTGVGVGVDDKAMAAFARAAADRGVRYVGGCCGTTARTLARMATALAADPETDRT